MCRAAKSARPFYGGIADARLDIGRKDEERLVGVVVAWRWLGVGDIRAPRSRSDLYDCWLSMSFKALKVWRALKRNPGSRRRDLAALTNMDVITVKYALSFLGRGGCAERTGRGSECRWTALDREPVDTRGANPNSLANLKHQAGRWRYVVYRKPLIKPNRPPPKVQPATELERCWPILGVIRQSTRDAG